MSDPVLRGQVWEFIVGGHRHRGVIISADVFNGSSAMPWSLPIGPARGDNGGGYAVALQRRDPGWPGLVHVPRLTRVDPTAFLRRLGTLTPATFDAVEVAFRAIAGMG